MVARNGAGAGHSGAYAAAAANGGPPYYVSEPPQAHHQPPKYDPNAPQQQQWYAAAHPHQDAGSYPYYGDGQHHHHNHHHHNHNSYKRHGETWFGYLLRQLAVIVPFVILILNINIYASRRGRYYDDTSDVSDPVYSALWLTVPVSGLILIWAVANIISMRRAPYRGGIPEQVQFGIDLLFSLGAAICWVLLLIHITTKQQNGYYEYPFLRYEGTLAFLLGLLMATEFGLCVRALSRFNAERKRRERDQNVIY